MAKPQHHFGSYETQEKSSLWSFEKETWIQGPDLQHLLKVMDEYYCAMASDR